MKLFDLPSPKQKVIPPLPRELIEGRRMHLLFDTAELTHPTSRLFENANIGNPTKTNLIACGGSPITSTEDDHSMRTLVILGIGARILGASYQEEINLLDHLRVTLTLGDIPQHDILGPQISHLRHNHHADRMKDFGRLADEPWRPDEHYGPMRKLNDLPRWRWPGYVYARPIILPVRQNFYVNVEKSPELCKQVIEPEIRVTLYAFSQRDW